MTMTAAPTQAPSADEISALTEELAEIAERLTEILSRETEFVRAMRIAEIDALQAAKTHLTALYQKTLKALLAAHDGQPLSLPVKERLAVSGERLGTAVTENELMLRVGRTATERLIMTIIEAVKEQQKSVTAYAPEGNTGPRRSFMTSAALDRRM
jgi:acetylglutamate kinase